MAQIIEQSDKFGKIGKAFGEGMGQQLPKEVDRYRLSQGLQKFEQESAGLSPMQQLTRLSSIPGITPQMIQSFGELAKQQSRATGLKRGSTAESIVETPTKNPYKRVEQPQAGGNEAPSVTTRRPIDATLNPKIPKTLTQLQNRAGQLLEENPGLYAQNPDLALQAAALEDKQEQDINQALQGQRKNEQDVQRTLEEGLRHQNQLLGAQVPGTVYSEIEDKAINAVRPKEFGGEGLTEQEAKKKYGAELDKVSRDYKALETLGKYKLLTQSAEGNKATLRSIREGFKERDDLENLADSYISVNGLSPSKAYYLAYPVSDYKEVNNTIKKLPKLENTVSFKKGYPEVGVPPEYLRDETLKASVKLAENLGDASLLSIGTELQAKGYDPQIWMNYIDKNRKHLNLSERQARELGKPRDFTSSLNDMWLFYLSGLDDLVEQ